MSNSSIQKASKADVKNKRKENIQRTGNVIVQRPKNWSKSTVELKFNQNTIGMLEEGTKEYISDQKIYVTTDYSIFKKNKANREINERHVDNLISLFGLPDERKHLKAGWNYKPLPIVVNEDMEVVDGQHRVEACKRIGLPVYYIKQAGWGINEILMMNNTSENWKNGDYLYAYAQLGNQNYIDLMNMYESYFLEAKSKDGKPLGKKELFPLQLFISLFDNARNPDHRPKRFKEGKFVFCKDENDIRNGKKALDTIMQLDTLYPDFWYTLRFCEAVINVAMNGVYYVNHDKPFDWDWDKFLHQCRQYGYNRIHKCAERKDYMPQIISVYNYNRSEGNHVMLPASKRYGKYSNKPF